jgi:hypothetical protein
MIGWPLWESHPFAMHPGPLRNMFISKPGAGYLPVSLDLVPQPNARC